MSSENAFSDRFKDWIADERVLVLAFSILFGLFAALISGYLYGMANQVEHLPIVLRMMDPEYLEYDFFVNEASRFGPRFYFAHAASFLGKLVPLPVLFSTVFLMTYVAVTAVTAFAVRDLTQSTTAGMLAAAFTIALTPFHLSNDANVVAQEIQPSFVAMPLALLALWKGIRGQPIWTASAAVIAMVIHPTIGLEVGGIALLASMAHRASSLWPFVGARQVLRRTMDIGVGMLIMGLGSLIWLVPTLATRTSFQLDSTEFIRILAYWRLPHHLVPSTFPKGEFVLAMFFSAAVFLALVQFRPRDNAEATLREHSARRLAVTTALVAVLLLGLGGYLFVEVFPSRLWTVAQTFRMMIVVAWIGWMLIGAMVADRLQNRDWRSAIVLISGTLSAPALFLAKLVLLAVPRFRQRLLLHSSVFYFGVMVVVGSAIGLPAVLLGRPTPDEVILLLIGAGAVSTTIRRRLAPLGISALGLVVILTAATLTLERQGILPSIPWLSDQIAKSQPILTLDDVELNPACRCKDLVTLAKVAKEITEPQAVFLTPWGWGLWRLVADRAIVADGKAFPYRDLAMREWYQRRVDIYESEEGVSRYPDQVTEAQLLDLRQTYGFQYAVLPEGTEMSFPVVATSGAWKLVQVSNMKR